MSEVFIVHLYYASAAIAGGVSAYIFSEFVYPHLRDYLKKVEVIKKKGSIEIPKLAPEKMSLDEQLKKSKETVPRVKDHNSVRDTEELRR